MADGGPVPPYSEWTVEQLLDSPCFEFYTDEQRKAKQREFLAKLDRLGKPVLD